MRNWCGFPAPAPAGEIPLCLVDGEFCCAGPDRPVTTFTNTIKNHPRINVTGDFHQQTRDEGVSMYLEVEDTLLKRLTSIWYERGFTAAIREAADPFRSRDCPPLALVASYALKVTNALMRLRYFLQPHLKDNGPKVIAKYSHTRNWVGSPVRCLAWHAHVPRLAVGAADDSIRVYATDAACVAVLKCAAQTHVSSVAWRPYAAAEIAVGCESGIIVWAVDPSSTFTKPSASHATVLSRAGHSPVTSVVWSPRGDLLVSCSASDSSFLIWDVALQYAIPMRRVAEGGVPFAIFSADADSLFSATTSMVFRVWDTRDVWTASRWVTRGGSVSAACCCPQGVWLFTVQEESLVYMLNSNVDPILGNKTNKATVVLDVSPGDVCGVPVGGTVLDMVWDPTGRFLAVIFHESAAVAVYATTHQLVGLRVTPCCVLTGMDAELANCIAFQHNFTSGACLTVAWSSGRVQHFPVVFSDP